MNREEIIRMARGAVRLPEPQTPQEEAIVRALAPIFERFAFLVAAAERNNLAAWMIERGYATGHGDSTEDLLKELEWQIAEREREACAMEAEYEAARWPYAPECREPCEDIAKSIRARGQA